MKKNNADETVTASIQSIGERRVNGNPPTDARHRSALSFVVVGVLLAALAAHVAGRMVGRTEGRIAGYQEGLAAGKQLAAVARLPATRRFAEAALYACEQGSVPPHVCTLGDRAVSELRVRDAAADVAEDLARPSEGYNAQ